MWPKLLELLSKYLLIPLLKEGSQWIIKTTRNWWRKRKLKKENQRRVENYEESTTINDAVDDFSEMP